MDNDELLRSDSWAVLRESAQAGATDAPAPESTECSVCGAPIIRRPGQRGKLAKVHPECKGAPTSPSRAPSPGRKTKAEREAEAIGDRLHRSLIRGSVYVSLVDAFDANAIRVATPEFTHQLTAVLAQQDKVRAKLMAASNNGSMIGLALSAIILAGPIAAHHGLIPAKVGNIPIGNILLNLPNMFAKLAQLEEVAEQVIASQLAAEANRIAEGVTVEPEPEVAYQ